MVGRLRAPARGSLDILDNSELREDVAGVYNSRFVVTSLTLFAVAGVQAELAAAETSYVYKVVDDVRRDATNPSVGSPRHFSAATSDAVERVARMAHENIFIAAAAMGAPIFLGYHEEFDDVYRDVLATVRCGAFDMALRAYDRLPEADKEGVSRRRWVLNYIADNIGTPLAKEVIAGNDDLEPFILEPNP
jgi:hypothetical protein